ncbi:MAG: formylglycine-generating enzyme family protein [Bacteroidia bacterium]|nr:formylglycine-generating enzyme family protein [Bacteroidia bacterium]
MKPYLIFSHIPHSSMIPVTGSGKGLQDYFIGQYPVTQALWEAVGVENPSRFQGSARPVEMVSWYDAVEFCNRLSEICGLEPVYQVDKTIKDPNNQNGFDDLKWLVIRKQNANGYRLPTEAEWEFAARGGIYGSGFEFSGSLQLDKVGWYDENSHRETQPVGLFAPNELRLYDISGNVWEWCFGWYGKKSEIQTGGPESGHGRVLRGGGWHSSASHCRVANRSRSHPDRRRGNFGIRLSKTAL